jgi:hypothetical protein
MQELARVRFAVEVLRDAGASGREIERVYLGSHSKDCACWTCVLELRNQVTLHRAKLVAQENWRRLSKHGFACEADPMPEGSPHDAVV